MSRVLKKIPILDKWIDDWETEHKTPEKKKSDIHRYDGGIIDC